MNFLNRKEVPLPSTITIMTIKKDNHIYDGIWYPFKEWNYTAETMPSEGYLGTFKFEAPQGDFTLGSGTFGFHAWEQNNSEFIEYSLRE